MNAGRIGSEGFPDPPLGPGIKASEVTKCRLCGRGVMHAGVPLFYRVRIESMGVDLQQVQRTHGMEQFFGGAVGLARVFYDGEIAKQITPSVTSLVCQSCAIEPHLVAMLAEAK